MPVRGAHLTATLGPTAARLQTAVGHATRTIAICRHFRWRNGMSEDLAHLEAAHRVQAGLSADERIDWIRQERWIHYPRADQVIDRLADLLTYPPRDRMPACCCSAPRAWGRRASCTNSCASIDPASTNGAGGRDCRWRGCNSRPRRAARLLRRAADQHGRGAPAAATREHLTSSDNASWRGNSRSAC